ncbi:class I SAM-dependent methyltransferase [Streptomyces capparidis]
MAAHQHAPHAAHSHDHTHTHTHEHAHDHAWDIDWAILADELEREGELHLPALGGTAAWLGGLLPGQPARILDVGSGPGVMTCVLARAFPHARVTAADRSTQLLERVRVRAEGDGVADRVTTLAADLPEGLAGAEPADLVWAARVVHHVGDQQAVLAALGRALRPGGVLAVQEGGTPIRFLPRDPGTGRPGFAERLDAAVAAWFDDMRTGLPGHVRVAEDWPALLTAAGLTPTGSRSFLTDLPAPLPVAAREHLHSRLTRIRDMAGERLDPEDLDTLDALLDRDAPTGVLRRPDAFLLVANTVHTARAD